MINDNFSFWTEKQLYVELSKTKIFGNKNPRTPKLSKLSEGKLNYRGKGELGIFVSKNLFNRKAENEDLKTQKGGPKIRKSVTQPETSKSKVKPLLKCQRI